MRIIFLGTSTIAVDTLKALAEKHEVVAVVTQPDKPKGRSKKLISSPIAVAADELNITVYKQQKIEREVLESLIDLNADIFVTFSYGVILRKSFLSITRLGGINIHPSLLPKLRGPSPIKTALLRGLDESGITIQTIKLKVDSGDVLFQKKFPISIDDDALSIESHVAGTAAGIINDVLVQIENETIKPIVQNETDVTYCTMISKDEGLLSWDESGYAIHNKVRAFVEWPVAYSFIRDIRINIYKTKINTQLNKDDYKDFANGSVLFADKKNGIVVKAHDCLLNIEKLQQKGKKILDWKSFINGFKDLAGQKFENRQG